MKKYKLKTKKAAKKRFTVTGSGKIKRYKTGRRHLLEHKSSSLIRSKRFKTGVSSSDMKKIKALLPGVDIKE
jgi:large subunit ribosomal protein L35